VSADVVSDRKDSSLPVAREILSYFLRNPGAADNLTEIARWRLMEETVRRSVESTEAALRWLVSEGFVSEETRRGTERIFQLNKARRKEAESFLRKASRNQNSKP
jgi:hypothetical protein